MATRAAGVFGSVYGRLGRAETLLAFCGSGVLVLGLLALRLWHEGVSPGLAEWSLWALALWPCVVGTVRVLAGQHAGLLAAGLWMMAASGALMAAGLAGSPDVQGWSAWGGLLAVFGAGWLWVQFERLGVVWGRLSSALNSEAVRDGKPADIIDRGFSEHFRYLIGSLTVLVALAYGLIWRDGAGAGASTAISTAIFIAFVALSFLPIAVGYVLKARAQFSTEDNPLFREDVVGPYTFAAMVTGCGLIATLATVAVRLESDTISTPVSYGTFAFVLLMFVAVIVWPHVSRAWRNRNDRGNAAEEAGALANSPIPPLNVMAKGASFVDSALVKLIAPLSGATERRGAHANVIAILTLLSALGFITPRPFGLVPIMLGIVFAVALGRRWAWVEADRETASRLESTRNRNIRLGFENDLKDEALLAYAGLFVLVPLTLYQIQPLTGFEPRDINVSGGLMTWIAFFGGELAKAVPFVDWWDIYGSDISPVGKHLTFLSRAMVDLVILAALFQALSIWQRNRVQDQLYDDGHLEAFDPFKEQDFFTNGVVAIGQNETTRIKGTKFSVRVEAGGPEKNFVIKDKFVERIEKHIKARKSVIQNSYQTPPPYSLQRLAELISFYHPDRSTSEEVRAGAEWMVRTKNLLVGAPAEQIGRLYDRWVATDFPAAFENAPCDPNAIRREQKLDFERVLVELSLSHLKGTLGTAPARDVIRCLSRVNGDLEFDFARVLAAEVLAKLPALQAVAYLSRLVAGAPPGITIPAAPNNVPHVHYPRLELRVRVYEQLGCIARDREAETEARAAALTLLRAMSDPAAEGSQTAANKAWEIYVASGGRQPRPGA